MGGQDVETGKAVGAIFGARVCDPQRCYSGKALSNLCTALFFYVAAGRRPALLGESFA